MNFIEIAMLVSTIITVLIVLVSMLLGFFKGWKKCLLGLCRTLTAAIIAFFAVFILCRAMPAGALYSELEPAVGEIQMISESSALQTIGGTFVYTLFMPFLFFHIFLFLDLILLIPAYFIGKALGVYPKDKSDAEKLGYTGKDLIGRFGGAAIRLVTVTVVTVITLLPISGIFYTFTDGLVKITQTAKEQDISVNVGKSNMQVLDYTVTDDEGMLLAGEVDRLLVDMLAPVRDNLFMRLSYSAPTRAICNAMVATTDASGQTRNEITQLFDVVADALYFMVEPDSYGEEQKDAVTRIIGYVSESELHSEVVADILTVVSENIEENAGESIDENDDLAIITEPFLEILSNTTAESVRADLNTVRDIIITIIDYDLPATIATALEQKSEADIIDAFANEEFLFELFSSLYHNDDFRNMTGPVIDFAFTIIVRQFDSEVGRINVAVVDENYTDESIRAEAKVFSALFADAKKVIDIAPTLVESGDAMSAIADADVKVLGHFVDSARDSKLIGGGVTTLLITVLESQSFDSMRDVADVLVKHISEDDDLSVENLLGAVQQFVAIMQLYESSGTSDTAELAKALSALNAACDDRTAVILKEIIDDSNILNAAILSSGDAQKNDGASTVLNVMLDKLTTGEYTEEQMETEAKAVDYAMQLVQASSSTDIKDICGDKEDRREMIEVINNSDIISSALVAMVYQDGDPTKPVNEDVLSLRSSLEADDIENIRNECKEFYQEQVKSGADTAQLDTNLKALSAIFDGKITDVDLAAWAAEAKGN